MRNWLALMFTTVLMTAAPLGASRPEQDRSSAWRMLIEGNPHLVDDVSIDWRQRLILHLLTPRQADDYFSGRASAVELIVEDGRNLAEAIEERTSSPAGVYVPFPVACRLFEGLSEEPLPNSPGREKSFPLTAPSGSVADCPIANEALAAVIQLRVQGEGAIQPRIKVWGGGFPEPATAVLEEDELWTTDRSATTIVNLCAREECLPARLHMRSSRAAAVQADLIGYFRPLPATDRIGPGPIIPLATEGPSNNFFGENAGANNTGVNNSFFGGDAGRENTTGSDNSFFGRSAGASNTTGDFNSFFGGEAGFSNTSACCNSFFGTFAGISNDTGTVNSFFGRGAGQSNETGLQNSFFGDLAGQNNTTGSLNSFFGRRAGDSNTVEDENTFIGAFTTGAPGVANSTALGAFAQVNRSDSLVLGSIEGLNGADVSVNVGIGTPEPQRQLHVVGDNATFRMDRSVDTAAFILVRTNEAGEPLKTFVVGTNASGSNVGQFIINDLGTAVGGAGARRMTITNDGEAHFTGTVRAPAFVTTSSLRYKEQVEGLQDALGLIERLQGVSFVWKESGKASVGLIAEEVAEVIPQVVHRDERDRASGVDYAALVGVLVEAVKSQQERIDSLRQEVESLKQFLVPSP